MTKKMDIIVLAKQVPDTHNVGPDAMTPEGTINRAALPTVFNPEDLNALEQAFLLREISEKKGITCKITMLTMGLPKAAEVLIEGIYRGADDGILLTDRALGGADTLATSYTLAQGIKKILKQENNPYIILCGRQAIDGDTAQVGPQVAEKLSIPQVTYTEQILDFSEGNNNLTIRRRIDGGGETVICPIPCLITVNGTAPSCRFRNIKRIMRFKKLMVDGKWPAEKTWGAADIEAEADKIGKAGSPTNVKAVKNIVFKAKESKNLTSNDSDIENLVKELIDNNTLG